MSGEPVGVPLPSPPGMAELLAQREVEFRAELTTLLNRYSRENGSDTPDFILADYLIGCLGVWDAATRMRNSWYGPAVIAEPLTNEQMRGMLDNLADKK